jgi:hypothetical protein
MGDSMGPQVTPPYLYVSQSATNDQVIALERLLQSFNPLHPAMILNVMRTEVLFETLGEARIYRAQIPGVVQMKVQRQLDAEGQPLMPTAAVDYFSNTLEYAQNVIYKAWRPDGGLKWDYSGRQANYRRIDLDSRDYKDGKMLIQFADGSGFFNDRQLELIKSLRLPTLHQLKPAKDGLTSASRTR